MNNAIRTFIERHGLAAAAIDAERLLADFSSEMSAGLAGAPSSLAMIPSYISLGHPVPVGKPVIVLDAGGTNLSICVVAFDAEGKPQISHFTKVSMPGIALGIQSPKGCTFSKSHFSISPLWMALMMAWVMERLMRLPTP